MINKSWNELNVACPIELDRIITYAKEFESRIPNKIEIENLNRCKEDVLLARGCFDSAVVTLIQNLYDIEILQKPEDHLLYSWLIDNLGRYLRKIDDDEFSLIVKLDEPDKERSSVGISRVSSFSTLLQKSFENIIYESILKATNEYNAFKETDKLKKTKRIFLYILFQILQVTLSILGGLTREKSSVKKGVINTVPTTWQGLLSEQGKEIIKKEYANQTGVDVNAIEKDLESLQFDEPFPDEEENDES